MSFFLASTMCCVNFNIQHSSVIEKKIYIDLIRAPKCLHSRWVRKKTFYGTESKLWTWDVKGYGHNWNKKGSKSIKIYEVQLNFQFGTWTRKREKKNNFFWNAQICLQFYARYNHISVLCVCTHKRRKSGKVSLVNLKGFAKETWHYDLIK